MLRGARRLGCPAAIGLCLALTSSCGASAAPSAPPASTAPSIAPLARRVAVADGHPLTIWEKRPPHPRGAILLVHGRTWSSLPNFDLQAPGDDRSVMNALVRAGYAAYAIDLRGYGATPRDATGWLTPDRAADDVYVALEWVRAAERGLHGAPTLIGYSRGASVALLTAQRHPTAMSALVLYGFPPDVSKQPPSETPPRLPNAITPEISDFITPNSIPKGVADAYFKQSLASDPIRADWTSEEQFRFEPALVHVPTLLIYGENDPRGLKHPAILNVFTTLGTADRAWVVIPRSDHAAHVEDARSQWLQAILSFLERPRPGS